MNPHQYVRATQAKDRGTNEANARKGELSSKLAKAPTSASVKDKDSRLPDRIVVRSSFSILRAQCERPLTVLRSTIERHVR